MPTIIKYRHAPNLGRKNKIPVTVQWKKEPMIRGHSLQAAVREIVRMTQALDVIKINLIGNPSSGKTTLAESIAHLIHEISLDKFKTPFAIKFFTRTELLNFEETLKTLQPTNHVLIFDDISFLEAQVAKKNIDIVKQSFTEIRHLQGGKDVKIVTIFNFHYQMAVQKYLRQSEFAFYTSIGSSDFDNVMQVVGKRYTNQLKKFQRLIFTATTRGKYGFNLGNKGKMFIYPYRKPFGPSLFYNGDTVRVVVFPKRDWIDKFCPTCIAKTETRMKDGLKVEEFAKDLSHKFGPSISRSAVRIKLFQNGLNVYPKSVKQALAYIDRYVKDRIPNLTELADYYDFKNDKVRVDTKYIDN